MRQPLPVPKPPFEERRVGHGVEAQGLGAVAGFLQQRLEEGGILPVWGEHAAVGADAAGVAQEGG